MRSSILLDIRESQSEIIQAMDRINDLRCSLYGRAIRYDGSKVQRSPENVMLDRMTDIVDKEAKIRRRQRRLNRRKEGIRRYLKKLDNEDHARVLDLYYLSLTDNGRLYSWSEVAREMHHPEGYVRNKMRYTALDRLNDIMHIY